MKRFSFLVAGVAGVLAASAATAGTLEDVRAKGFIQCGVSQGLPGFSNADDDGKWGDSFGVGSFFGMYKRVSFLLDKTGKIAKIYDDVAPARHAAEVLADVPLEDAVDVVASVNAWSIDGDAAYAMVSKLNKGLYGVVKGFVGRVLGEGKSLGRMAQTPK